ncbi:hypothetical protein [Desulfogranum mediterraneum]|uniref:hypothetical protein n=1 Tax=Desulfogranum mediterraneum TaxID=160661 RepID=UPI000420114A|nr:hypothetical protein [Desulfogranum mediterraneum]
MVKKTMVGPLLAAVGLVVLMGVGGCAKQKSYGAVEFTTVPTGAEVVNLRDDATLGTAPLVVTWEAEEGKPEYVTVQMRKSGFREEITSFWVNTRHSSREEAQAQAQQITVEMMPRKRQ